MNNKEKIAYILTAIATLNTQFPHSVVEDGLEKKVSLLIKSDAENQQLIYKIEKALDEKTEVIDAIKMTVINAARKVGIGWTTLLEN